MEPGTARLHALLQRLPSRPQVMLGVGYLVLALLLPDVLAKLDVRHTLWIAGLLLVVAGAGVIRPWQAGSWTGRVAIGFGLLVGTVGRVVSQGGTGIVATSLSPLAAAAARGAALLLLIYLVLRSDGGGWAEIGLSSKQLGAELLWGGPALGLVLSAHVATSVTLALVFLPLKIARHESLDRQRVLGALLDSVSLSSLFVILVIAATFEEVLFRGFLLPRMRLLLGTWSRAVIATSLLFGALHLYEGPFAVVQTAMLGVYLCLVFLWRGDLAAPVVAHVGFNALMFGLTAWVQRSGLLDRVRELTR